jgi:hypothetical protein
MTDMDTFMMVKQKRMWTCFRMRILNMSGKAIIMSAGITDKEVAAVKDLLIFALGLFTGGLITTVIMALLQANRL